MESVVSVFSKTFAMGEKRKKKKIEVGSLCQCLDRGGVHVCATLTPMTILSVYVALSSDVGCLI